MKRLLRKWRELARYPRLGFGFRDRCLLFLYALIRCRVLPRPVAILLLKAAGNSAVTLRLTCVPGSRIAVDLLDQAQIDVFDELFLERIYDVQSVPVSPDVVVDCGAFCGYFSLLAAHTFPGARVVCFEPEPCNVERIRRQMALAGVNVEVVPKAVSTQDGVVKFAGSGLGGAIIRCDQPETSIDVGCVDLRACLQTWDCRRLLLKLDIEGEEKSVLPAILPLLPAETFCFLETHHSDEVCRSLLDPYRAAGFTVRETRRRPAPALSFDYVEWTLSRTPMTCGS